MKLIKLFIAISLSLIVACSDTKLQLEKIKERGELRVLSRYGLTSYYLKGDEVTGFEYDLAKRFAKRLDVQLKMINPDDTGTFLKMIGQGKADIAAGMAVMPARENSVRFGPVYQEIVQQLVYRQGTTRPKNLNSLRSGVLEVVADSSHVEQLKLYQNILTDLDWIENTELNSGDLLELVQLKLIDYTIADSNEVDVHLNLFPELRVAFDVSAPHPLAWALPLTNDNSLYNEVTAFFNELEKSGELAQLIEKHYGHISHFDYVDTRKIHHRILTRLPEYQGLFEQAAGEFGFDWKLLAATAYQESHWQRDAVSKTGVKGLMMLTKVTAKHMDIANREDPAQSIYGGAKYLAFIYKNLPDTVIEPDRTWLMLAAYNLGRDHLQDARILTEKRGGNPNLWSDIKLYLPLLSKRKWYKQTRHGYARGGQAVHYVTNIRRYYDILVHSKREENPPTINEEQAQSPPAAL